MFLIQFVREKSYCIFARIPKFIKVMPTEYKRVLIEMHANLDKSKSTAKG